ncbi:hypothetical protein L1887_23521 [Cichorium endivia]|nr:hypothetical protein L1887_23521 [Cichorium endivia]
MVLFLLVRSVTRPNRQGNHFPKISSNRATILPSRDLFSYDEPNLNDCVISHSEPRDNVTIHVADGVRIDNPLGGNQLGSGPSQNVEIHMPWSDSTDTGCSQGEYINTPYPNDCVTMSPPEGEENNEMHHELSHVHSLGSSRPKRESKLHSRFNDFNLDDKYSINKVVTYSFLNEENKCFVSNLNKTVEPQNFLEASSDSDWVKAMNEELEALYRNNTWVVTDFPSNRKPIGWLSYQRRYSGVQTVKVSIWAETSPKKVE